MLCTEHINKSKNKKTNDHVKHIFDVNYWASFVDIAWSIVFCTSLLVF